MQIEKNIFPKGTENFHIEFNLRLMILGEVILIFGGFTDLTDIPIE